MNGKWRIKAWVGLLTVCMLALVGDGAEKRMSPPTTGRINKELSRFWKQFQSAGSNGRMTEIMAMARFPLLHAGWLADRFDDSSLSREEFEQHFSKVFTPKLKKQLLDATINDLMAVSSPGARPTSYRLTLTVKHETLEEDATESSIIFEFCLENGRYQLCALWLAG